MRIRGVYLIKDKKGKEHFVFAWNRQDAEYILSCLLGYNNHQRMKIRLAKKIMNADTYADYPSKHPSPYWKTKFKEAYNEYGCVMFCEDSSKCKYRNKFDNRIKKAMSLTI